MNNTSMCFCLLLQPSAFYLLPLTFNLAISYKAAIFTCKFLLNGTEFVIKAYIKLGLIAFMMR